MATVTKERALSELEYRPQCGDFLWMVNRGRKIKGAVAGWTDNLGYRLIRIDGTLYRVHHLVHLMETGEMPKGDVDHIDGNPANNVFSNLRVCTHSENQKNMKRHRDNKSGFKGVFWNTQKSKWQSKICFDGVTKHLGFFSDATAAAIAYNSAAKLFHGNFSKLNEV
jgi:hypothetical protein